MRIGIMGAPVNNSNHGCVALLYSLVHILSRIEREEQEDFEYVIFDWKYNEESIQMMSNLLKIDINKIVYAPYVLIGDPVRLVYHMKNYFKMKAAIKKCDCIIDVTEGDSFSDIYGDAWLKGRTKVKLLVEKLGIPLILAPQTYGPYLKEENRLLAARSIKGAYAVMTRDRQSGELVKSIAGIDSVYTTDLAFALPYTDYKIENTDKIKIGLNASNLLYFSSEMKDRKFTLSSDYKKYLEGLMDFICESGKYEVYFISHVDGDYEVHKILKEKYPESHLIPLFKNPVEAKSCISKMDIFIGARMHGNIAAFTSGVPCIPNAYSPKFAGLFKSVGYDTLVDLTLLSTENAIEKTIEYIGKYMELKAKIKSCLIENNEIIQGTKKYMQLYLEALKK